MQRQSPAAINSEVGLIKSQIADLERREDGICRIDMSRFRDSVRADKQALLEQSQALEAHRWPIHWLPNELLIQIFIAYTELTDVESDKERLYHKPPVILSHVCMRWRKVCLTTSCLWSRISHGSGQFSRVALLTFIERSNSNPLDFVFGSPRGAPGIRRNLDDTVSQALTIIYPHISRLRSIVFRCHGVEAMKEIVDIINVPTNDFSKLHSLALSITNSFPSFWKEPSLIELHNSRRSGSSGITSSFVNVGSLRYLRLEQVPLFNVPQSLLSSVLSIELYFPPQPYIHVESISGYILRISDLCQFLSFMPQLEDIILGNTVPFFDIKRPSKATMGAAIIGINESEEAPGVTSRTAHSIELPALRSIEWSYPYPADVHRFLRFLYAPSLETIDLDLNDLPSTRSQVTLYRGYDEDDDLKAYRQNPSIEYITQLDSLKELTVHCVDHDALTHVFRYLTFPVLEKLEIVRVGPRRRKGSHSPAVFPRLESIFRDPRLPHLTHLTLSHFHLDSDHSKSMFGYMPALTSLSLDTCSGVEILLEDLAETSLGRLQAGLPNQASNRRLPIKFCPRLEFITLLVCDVEIEGLRKAVKARNMGEYSVVPAGDAGTGNPVQASAWGKVTLARPIKKLRRPLSNLSSSAATCRSVEDGATSTTIPIEAALCPARIIYVHIEKCGSITEEEALSLRDLGVDDVLWSNV